LGRNTPRWMRRGKMDKTLRITYILKRAWELAFDIAEAREDVKKGRLYTADQIRQDLKIKHRKEIYL